MSKISRFAGLMGHLLTGASAEAVVAAEKPTKKDDESQEDFDKRLKEWEDAQDDGEEGKKGKNADMPKDTTDDSPEQPDDKVKKAIQEGSDKARAEGHAAGAKAEKARWADTLASDAAKGKPISAISLLADSDMTAAALQKTLAALPVENARTTLAQRNPNGTPAPAPLLAGDAADGQKQPGKFAARVAQALENINGKKAA